MADISADITTKAELEGGFSTFGSFSGQLEKAGDHDWIKVTLDAGFTYEFYASFLNTGSDTIGDSFLWLRDATGAVLAFDDDNGVGLNSFLSYNITTTGTYFIDIGESGDNDSGDYGLYMVGPPPAPQELMTDGNDNEVSFFQNNGTLVGGKGADYIRAGIEFCTLLGEQGNDILIGSADGDHISGGLGHDTIDGAGGEDVLFGDAGNDDMSGGNDRDDLYGGTGNDHLDGGAGTDFLYGGGGKDFLTGGSEKDLFIFLLLSDSKSGTNRDVIADFSQVGDHDLIALSPIDAKKGGADNAFKFIGSHAFHHKAGELHYLQKNGYQIVEGDVNGDGKADFQIEVHGASTLHATDFLL